jgi:Ni,Fe-hydrogenase III small subunit
MNPLSVLWRRRMDVFHVRMGGCSGCAQVVDSALRNGRWPGRLGECSSPRHASLIVVSGLWTPGLTGPALDVISQAPEGCLVLLAGDCALGTGTFGTRGSQGVEAPPGGAQRVRISGCPLSEGSLREAVHRVEG